MTIMTIMIENELEVFADGLANCFESFSDESAKIGTPFLTKNINDYLEEFTGCIRVSGTHHGAVYFTANEPLLKNLLWSMNVLDNKKAALSDLVGEISNIVSGSARTKFGDKFYISVPTVLTKEYSGEEDTQTEIMAYYVIPVNWRHLTANLIIDLH